MILLAGSAMAAHPGNEANAKMQKQAFGKISDGQSADLYTLTNKHGMEVTITNFGATVVSISVPDKSGKSSDVTLGHTNAGEYETGKGYLGATVGRYGNRIAHGKFSLDGQEYNLPKNDGENSLHGGKVGFNGRINSAMFTPPRDKLC